MKIKDFSWNVPNLLSLYRLASFPFVLYAALSGLESLFAILLIVNYVTDILDGFLARVLKQQTAIGAQIDSLADIGTSVLSLLGIYLFKWNILVEYQVIIFTFVVLYIMGNAIALYKFKRLAAFHLVSFKVAAYAVGIFISLLFSYGFIAWLFYTAICICIFASLEEIVAILILKQPRTNAKGLWWLMRKI